jgi:hypothetical protein
MVKKMKRQKRKRVAGRTSGRIGEARLVVEIIEVDSEEVVVAFVVRIEAAAVVSEVAEGVSVVVEGDSDIVMGAIILGGEGGEASGVEVVEEETGGVLGRALMVKVVGEVSEEVKEMADTRRGTPLVAAKIRKLSLMIKFEGE